MDFKKRTTRNLWADIEKGHFPTVNTAHDAALAARPADAAPAKKTPPAPVPDTPLPPVVPAHLQHAERRSGDVSEPPAAHSGARHLPKMPPHHGPGVSAGVKSRYPVAKAAAVDPERAARMAELREEAMRAMGPPPKMPAINRVPPKMPKTPAAAQQRPLIKTVKHAAIRINEPLSAAPAAAGRGKANIVPSEDARRRGGRDSRNGQKRRGRGARPYGDDDDEVVDLVVPMPARRASAEALVRSAPAPLRSIPKQESASAAARVAAKPAVASASGSRAVPKAGSHAQPPADAERKRAEALYSRRRVESERSAAQPAPRTHGGRKQQRSVFNDADDRAPRVASERDAGAEAGDTATDVRATKNRRGREPQRRRKRKARGGRRRRARAADDE